MTAFRTKELIIFSIVIIISVAIGFNFNPQPSRSPLRILRSLAKLVPSPLVSGNLTIVLGYNVCVDAIARWDRVLTPQEVATVPGRDVDFLRTQDDVNAAFRHYFSDGAAAERGCNPEVFDVLTKKALQSSATLSLGGNAALIARKLAKLDSNINVVLNGHIGPQAVALLDKRIIVPAKIHVKDEVHLILEYSKGDMLTDNIQSPRANRFIITADESNQNANALVDTINAAITASADALVIAGLHMLEPLPHDKRLHTLQTIAATLKQEGRPQFTVHLELASAADKEYMRQIVELLFPLVDSVGFNEQEAAFLYESLGGVFSDGSVVTAKQDIASLQANAHAITRLLHHFFDQFPAISRFHFHSLLYHVIGYNTTSIGTKWRGGKTPVANGALHAFTEACKLDVANAQEEHVLMLAPLDIVTNATANATHAYSHMAPVAYPKTDDGNYVFAVAPVPVCKSPQSTVGLGDAISAAGLAADVVKAGEGAPEQQLSHKWRGLRVLLAAFEKAKELWGLAVQRLK